MMANLQADHRIISVSRTLFLGKSKILYPVKVKTTLLHQKNFQDSIKFRVTSLADRNSSSSGSALVQQRPPSTDEEMVLDHQTAEKGGRQLQGRSTTNGYDESRELDYLVKEYGWQVRRMAEEKSEIKEVARIQAQAFHEPALFFDDFFFYFFEAEVLTAIYYRIRNSPPDRYACLVAEPAKENEHETKSQQHQGLVGVVDVTVLRDKDVRQHLEGVEEYLYVSGIAVSNNFRRQKVATALLKACEVISVLWGYKYLVLRAYEDDSSARALYTNAGYSLVSRDPPWVNWIGRKRRILMIKRVL